MIRKRRVAGLIAIAAIVLFIYLDIFFEFTRTKQNFLTHLIALGCILFIGWYFLSKPRKIESLPHSSYRASLQVFWRYVS